MEHKPEFKKVNKALDDLISSNKQSDDQDWSHISCPNCASLVKAADISLEKEVAKCDSCHAIFSIKSILEQKHQKAPKPLTEIPDGIYEMDTGYEREIRCYFEYTSNPVSLAILCLVFAIFCFGFIYWTRTTDKGGLLFFDIMFSLLGAGSLLGFIDLLNQKYRPARLKIDDFHLQVKHTFLQGEKKYDIDDLKHAEIQLSKYKDIDNIVKNLYNIILIKKNGDQVTLFKKIKLEKQAQYVTEQINHYLKK